MSDQILMLTNEDDIADLSLYLRHLIQLDQSVVVRLQQSGDRVLIWADPGFRALAVRGIAGTIAGEDIVVGGDATLAGLLHAQQAGSLAIDVGFRMDSAWAGGRPSLTGYMHIDELSAKDIVRLADQGQQTAMEHPGPLGIPTSLLNQEVIVVENEYGPLGIRMRTIFTLVSCGFLRVNEKRQVPQEDTVFVRATDTWLRLDARYGSVAQRLTTPRHSQPRKRRTGNTAS